MPVSVSIRFRFQDVSGRVFGVVILDDNFLAESSPKGHRQPPVLKRAPPSKTSAEQKNTKIMTVNDWLVVEVTYVSNLNKMLNFDPTKNLPVN